MAASVADRVYALVLPVAEQMGYSIWDVEFKKEGSLHILRIFIDKESGISLDDCADFSHAIDPILDREDPISTQYYLEVSSAGLTRQLRKPEHFDKTLGSKVELKLYKAQNGEKLFEGVLVSHDENSVTVEIDGSATEFEKKDIAEIHLAVDF